MFSSLIPSLVNHLLSKTKILKGTVVVTKEEGINIDLEIDFSTLPRSVQKFIPLQKLQINGQISKIPSLKELRNTEAAFKAIAFFKEFGFLGRFDFKNPRFSMGLESNAGRTRIPFAKIERDIIVSFSVELYTSSGYATYY